MGNFEDPMVDLSLAFIDRLSIHRVGNQENEVIELSEHSAALDADILSLLTSYFLKPFSEQFFYHLGKENYQLLNAVEEVFKDPGSFHEHSINLARHLFSVSSSPAIKTGEFFMVLFKECQVEDELLDAVGIFKAENKNTFLKVYPENNQFTLGLEEGININKLDKGVIIFNGEREDGFLVQMVDQASGQGASYWKENFLQLTEREDSYHHTKNYIQMCRDFAMEEMSQQDRGQQIGLVNETVSYFKENEHFDKDDFQRQVIREPEIIEAFEDYSKSYELEHHLNNVPDFDISSQAVKNSKRFIRSVIKLDKNFHIYVHGNRERIKRGRDELTGLNYYQVFFDEEH